MNIRPYRNINRRKTKKIMVGNVPVGGNSPITVQSMTNTLTTDIQGTINQIKDIVDVGKEYKLITDYRYNKKRDEKSKLHITY